MPDNLKQSNSKISSVRKNTRQWAFTHFERRALWILSIFLISGTALRIHKNHRLKSGLDLIPAFQSIDQNKDVINIAELSNVDFPININIASQFELEQLPGIGPVKALAIIDYILANGPIKELNEILNIKGIGPATMIKIDEFIVVLP